MQMGDTNNFGYGRMIIDQDYQILKRDNFVPNLQHLIKYPWGTGPIYSWSSADFAQFSNFNKSFSWEKARRRPFFLVENKPQHIVNKVLVSTQKIVWIFNGRGAKFSPFSFEGISAPTWTNFMQNLSPDFLIWPSIVPSVNTKNKRY